MEQLSLTVPTYRHGDRVRIHDAIGYSHQPTGTLQYQVEFGDHWWRVQLDDGSTSIFAPYEFQRFNTEELTHDSTDSI